MPKKVRDSKMTNSPTLQRNKSHLVFVSLEITPNLVPVLDKRLEAKQVFLVYTQSMVSVLERLKDFYHQHNLKTIDILIDNAFCIDSINTGFDQINKLLNHDLSTLLVNISCGTKLMGISATQYFQGSAARLYFVLPNDDLIWVQPREKGFLSLQDSLKLEEFLFAHGVERFEPFMPKAHEAVAIHTTLKLIKQFVISDHSFAKFTQLVHNMSQPKKEKLSLQPFSPIFEKLKPHGLRLNADNSFFESSHLLVNLLQGSWFESYIADLIKELKLELESIQNVAVSVKIHYKGNISDEIDVMFLANNHLFIIECKTGTSHNYNLHLQRMDSLAKKLGGELTAKALIITSPITKNGGLMQKAEQLNVKFLSLESTPNLKQSLKKWILENSS